MAEEIPIDQALERFLGARQAYRPCVVYSKPGSENIEGLFQISDAAYSNSDFQERGFVFNSFDSTVSLLIPGCSSTKTISSFDFNVAQKESSFTVPDGQNFKRLVRSAIETIKSGSCRKIVVSRKEELELADFSIKDAFLKLLKAYPSAFRYLFYHPKAGTWMGATPEQLIKTSGSEFSVMSLAGTRKSSDENAEWGAKEVAEQKFVTDYILEELSSIVDTVKVSEPYTQQAGNISHIRSDIKGELLPARFADAMAALHPTPAVCGLPKEPAIGFINKNEGYNREFYSGFLGEVNLESETHSSSDLYVNLRCMKIQGNKITLFVGCGITADSVPEDEFEETVNKSMTLKRIL